ncbi:hypothetical protein MFLAVUS_003887 [Mucor flavus]|uniref:Adaptin small chain n=1 Tax=Mucor flavus TaxID=439312 RepID=A0ABP9YUD9_9FUNG
MTTSNPIFQYMGSAALAGVAVLGAIYNDRAVFDERRKGIKTQPGWPLVGNLPLLIQYKDQMHDFLLAGFNELDEMTLTMSALGIPRHVATLDPQNVEHLLKHNFENYIKGPEFHASMVDMFGNGIFNANGEDWKYQRKTASHIFNVKNFRDQFTDVFVEEIDFMSSHIWDKAAEENQVVDFHEVMFKFTLDSFILLGFGVHLHAQATEGKVPFAAAFDEAQKTTFQRFVNPIWPITERIMSITMPWKQSMSKNLNVVDSFAREVTEKRRVQIANGEVHKDLLSRFMDARNAKGELLNNDELRDTVLNFVVAGRDTTAQALSWTFYMLLCHPRVEEKLLNEINQYITDDVMHDSAALYEVIKDMTYAHAVFYEVLRLYPSVPLNQKYALNDDIWPDGTQIRKGDYILWCPYAQGRSEKVWGADAKVFRPERWIKENGDLKRESQGQWPAFHAGPRVCLGQNLATLEALVAIIFLVKRYKFSLVAGQDITYQVSLTLPMLNGMKLRFILVQNRQGKTRLAKWYVPYEDEEKIKLKGEVHRLIAPRDQKHQSNFVEFRNYKIVYRRYAGLFFCVCVDANDNELSYLEAIHFFVEVLDAFFGNVCELDLVFNFYKVYAILDEVFLAGEIEETSKNVVLTRLDHLDKLE